MASAAVSSRAMCATVAAKRGDACLMARRVTYSPYRPRKTDHLDGAKMARLKCEGLLADETV